MQLDGEGGRHELTALAHEQRRGERALELRDLIAERRLGPAELRCGGGDAAELVDGNERRQEREVRERHRGDPTPIERIYR
jgi:hypothetical protein